MTFGFQMILMIVYGGAFLIKELSQTTSLLRKKTDMIKFIQMKI
jgi:hypothetical protein